MVASPSHPLWRFLILYGTLYAGFGVQSPYLPNLLDSRNLAPEAIATLLAAGSAIRLVAGPVAGRLADTLDAPKAVLAAASPAPNAQLSRPTQVRYRPGGRPALAGTLRGPLSRRKPRPICPLLVPPRHGPRRRATVAINKSRKVGPSSAIAN
jgi:MFS family permease